MKKILLFIICIFSSEVIQAQITFEKTIDTLSTSEIRCIKETFDGGYVFCSMDYSAFVRKMIVTKIDSLGNIEWAKNDFGYGYPTAILQTPDSGFMVYGNTTNNQVCLIKLNNLGDTLWTKTFALANGPANTSPFNGIASINNSLYGLIGYSYNQNAAYFIAEIGNGIQAATKFYNYSTSNIILNAIDKTYNNNFIIAGQICNSSTSSDIYLIHANCYGDTIWTKRYDKVINDLCYDVKQTSDSGFIILGAQMDTSVCGKANIFLIKTNSNGDTLWTKVYYNSYSEGGTSIVQTNDGNYLITGARKNTNNTQSLKLMKVDNLGNMIWDRQFIHNTDNDGICVIQTKDDGFIVSGRTGINSTNNNIGYLIKTNNLGLMNSQTGLNEYSDVKDLNIYPNPSNGRFTIREDFTNNAQFYVYNTSYQCVYSCNFSNKFQYDLNLSHLNNGLYFIVLNDGNSLFTKKLIIQK